MWADMSQILLVIYIKQTGGAMERCTVRPDRPLLIIRLALNADTLSLRPRHSHRELAARCMPCQWHIQNSLFQISHLP